MKKSSLLLVLLFLISCGTTKYIPTDTKETIVYRDSIVYVKDTISVLIPYEVVRETIPIIDTSVIKTSYAQSVAYIDTTNRSLFHTLEQKGNIDVPIDTLILVEYKDREIEKVLIKEVEKEVPFIPIIFYITFVFSIVIVVIYVVKLTH